MKTLLKILILFTALTETSLAATLSQDFLIAEPTLAQQIKKAYWAEMNIQPDGSYTFSHLIKVKNGQVYLMKGGWEVTKEPSFMRDVMFTPIDNGPNSSVFDLMEYMRTQPITEYDGNVITRKKELKSVVNNKEYSLICVESGFINQPQKQVSQCVLYNGLPL